MGKQRGRHRGYRELNRRISRRVARHAPAVLLAGTAAFSGAAMAGSMQFGDSIDVEYTLTANYAVGVRMEDQDQNLINGPVDPLQPAVLPPGQLVGFTHTGLPVTMNFDDGNRNFEKHSLINNRLTLFGEFEAKYENYGVVASGDAFYDESYHDENDNDSPETINKRGPHDEFTDSTTYFSGERARILDAYVYGDWTFGDNVFLNLRAGRQVVAWGESLFFTGLALSQGRADATRAFVPGAEIKEILLPTNQIAARLTLGDRLTLLSYYKLEFKPTEIFPLGHYFSPADAVGPGAKFVYGSINPAALNGCPGLLGPLSPLCNLGGIGTPLLNAPPNILTTRGPDIQPDKEGQWGVGGTYQLTPTVTTGLYHIRYHHSNPTVKLNFGYAFVGSVLGVPITTAIVNQTVPVTYQVKYFDDVKMTAASLSTVVGPFNVAGEISYRQGIDTSVQAILSGVRSPIFTRADVSQAQVSFLYAANPKFVFHDIALVGEAGYLYVNDVDPISAQPGVIVVGDGDVLFNDKKSYAYQLLALGKRRNVFAGWDAFGSLSWADLVKGNPPVNGIFGSLFGEGDQRLSIGGGIQYLQNLEFGLSYNWFFGDPEKLIAGDDSPVRQNPFVDRDYLTFNIKYSL